MKTLKINPVCGKCKNRMEIRVTTEAGDNDKIIPEILMIYGVCKKCKVIIMLDLLKLKDISGEQRK